MDSGAQFALQDLPPLACQRTARDVLASSKQTISLLKQQLKQTLDASGHADLLTGKGEVLVMDVVTTSSKDDKDVKTHITTPMTSSSSRTAGGSSSSGGGSSSSWMAWPGDSSSGSSTKDPFAHTGGVAPVSTTLGELLQNLGPALETWAATMGPLGLSSNSPGTDAATSTEGGSNRVGPTIAVEGLSDMTPDQQLHMCIKVSPLRWLAVGALHACMGGDGA